VLVHLAACLQLCGLSLRNGWRFAKDDYPAPRGASLASAASMNFTTFRMIGCVFRMIASAGDARPNSTGPRVSPGQTRPRASGWFWSWCLASPSPPPPIRRLPAGYTAGLTTPQRRSRFVPSGRAHLGQWWLRSAGVHETPNQRRLMGSKAQWIPQPQCNCPGPSSGYFG
jgi:hypothetical protein